MQTCSRKLSGISMLLWTSPSTSCMKPPLPPLQLQGTANLFCTKPALRKMNGNMQICPSTLVKQITRFSASLTSSQSTGKLNYCTFYLNYARHSEWNEERLQVHTMCLSHVKCLNGHQREKYFYLY